MVGTQCLFHAVLSGLQVFHTILVCSTAILMFRMEPLVASREESNVQTCGTESMGTDSDSLVLPVDGSSEAPEDCVPSLTVHLVKIRYLEVVRPPLTLIGKNFQIELLLVGPEYNP